MQKFQEELVIKNDNLVHYLVRKVNTNSIRGFDYDDFLQIGRIGLIKAAKTYNGISKFSAYAVRCITNEIFMVLRKEKKNIDYDSLDEIVSVDCNENKLYLIDTIKDSNSEFSDLIENLDDIEKVFNIALNELKTKEILIWLYLILEKKQENIARMLGVDPSYVSKLKSKIYDKINNKYNENLVIQTKYKLKVTTTISSISFSVQDINQIDKLVLKLLECSKINSKFRIKVDSLNVSLCFSNIEEAVSVIAVLVDIIDKNDIILVDE